MPTIVGEIAIKVGADISALVSEFARSGKSFKTMRSMTDSMAAGFERVGQKAGNLGLKLTGVTTAVSAVVGAGIALARSSAEQSDAVDKASKSAGLSAKRYQELQFALTQVTSATTGELDIAFQNLNKKLGQAAAGSESAQKAFEKIGISQQDIANGSVTAESALNAMISKLNETKDASEAAAIATALLGGRGKELGPQLMGAKEDISSLEKKANDLNLIIGDDAVAAGDRFGDAYDQMMLSLQGLKTALGNELVPVMVDVFIPAIQNNVIPALIAMVKYIGEAADWFNELPDSVKYAAGIIAAVLGVGGPVLIAVGAMSSAIGLLIAATGPIGLFIIAATALATAWAVWGDDIKEAVGGAIDWITEKFNAFLEYMKAIPAMLIEIGQQMIQGLIDGVMAKWEELKATVLGLTELLPQWMREGLDIHSPSRVFAAIGENIGAGLAEGIISSQGMIANAIAVTGNGAVAATDGMVGGILDSMGQLFKGSKVIAVAQALVNAWTGATEALKMPFPKNLIAFASVLATGLGAVKNIKNTNVGSSSTAGSAAGATTAATAALAAPAATSAPEAAGSTYSISLVGDVIGKDGLKQLFSMINTGIKNGHRIDRVEFT